MIRGSGCSKSRFAKAAGAEVTVQHRNEKWHAAVARSTFQVKMHKTLHVRTTFQVPMSKTLTPLWREAHLQVKMHKTLHVS